MSATLAGLFKAGLEAQGWGIPWFRDGAPETQVEPLGIIQEGIGVTPEHHGDYGDLGAHQGDLELVQIDLYQLSRVPDPARPGHMVNAETRALPGQVRRWLQGALRGQVYGSPPIRVYGVTVQSGQRWPIVDNLVRHTWTVAVRRDA